MDCEFTQLGAKSGRRKLRNLALLCHHARSLEEIALGWVARGRSFTIARCPESSSPSLELCFVAGNDTVAVATIPLERFAQSYCGFEPLNETILRFDDQDGFIPDNDWFDRRNTRLGIAIDDRLEMNVAPAMAVGELILSYALASAGYAEISQGKRVDGEQYLQLSLIFFGPSVETNDVKSHDGGWYENAGVELAELKRFVSAAYWM